MFLSYERYDYGIHYSMKPISYTNTENKKNTQQKYLTVKYEKAVVSGWVTR